MALKRSSSAMPRSSPNCSRTSGPSRIVQSMVTRTKTHISDQLNAYLEVHECHAARGGHGLVHCIPRRDGGADDEAHNVHELEYDVARGVDRVARPQLVQRGDDQVVLAHPESG